jgi:hypothetical protein
MWTVWHERNSITFEDVMKSADQLLNSFVESLFDWSRAWEEPSECGAYLIIKSVFMYLPKTTGPKYKYHKSVFMYSPKTTGPNKLN